jgi:hypothetical protein
MEYETINEEIKKEREREKEKERDDLKKILETPEGRRFLWRLLSEARVFTSCYSVNTNDTYYLEGKRDIGLFVLKEITEVNKNALAKIQNEYYSAKKGRK